MGMKILLIDLEFYPLANANIAILFRLFGNQPEPEVSVLTEWIDGPQKETVQGIKIIRKEIHSARTVHKPARNLGSLGQYAGLLGAKVKTMRADNNIDYKRAEDFLAGVKKVLAGVKFDAVISVSSPIESHICGQRIAAMYHVPWIPYYLDPFSTNHVFPENTQASRIRFEEELLSHAGHMLMMEPIPDDYLSHQVHLDENKVTVLGLPGIRHVAAMGRKPDFFDTQAVNCVFIGNLYAGIRNPGRLIELFKKLGNGYHLYFIGNHSDPELQKQYRENSYGLLENVTFIDPVPASEAEEIMMAADVLVNIGNSVENQIPSKIFDYISSGRPVLNLYKIKNCPSLQYFREYPSVVHVFEEEADKPETVQKVRGFLDEAGNMKPLDEKIIREIWKENTPETVRAHILEALRQVTGGQS